MAENTFTMQSRTPWTGPQAVMFTHCGDLTIQRFNQNPNALIREYGDRLKPYIECNQQEYLVGIVYLYIDVGMRTALDIIPGKPLQLTPQAVWEEQQLKWVLQQAVRQARRELGIRDDGNRRPRFRFVGLLELIDLLNNLQNVSPELLQFLRGPGVQFTYDAPKFVEAIIRLARADIPFLAQHPVLRIDDDVSANAEAIKFLLEEFTIISDREPFFFLSGRYGRADGNPDPINNYAVRQHWFFPDDAQPGDPRFVDGSDPAFVKGMEASRKFFADLAVLGAQQPGYSATDHSVNLRAELSNLGWDMPQPRPSPQVISGAGLIMGRRNIALLPPFSNFGNLVVWIDDFLKRLLHEKLGDIRQTDPESVTRVSGNNTQFAIFAQARHPNNTGVYLGRLAAGSMFQAIINDEAQRDGSPAYSAVVREIVWGKKTRKDMNSKKFIAALEERLTSVAYTRYKFLLKCWNSPEFADYESYRWAQQQLLTLNSSATPQSVTDVVKNAIAYLIFLSLWPVFTRSIERMKFPGNEWLYESIP